MKCSLLHMDTLEYVRVLQHPTMHYFSPAPMRVGRGELVTVLMSAVLCIIPLLSWSVQAPHTGTRTAVMEGDTAIKMILSFWIVRQALSRKLLQAKSYMTRKSPNMCNKQVILPVKQ